jgi:molecular chaperone DnaJ
MAGKRDYYEVLSVSRSAEQTEIASAYREMAMQYHPDRNQGDEDAAEKFKEAAEAFDVLNSPEKRAKYDQFGHAGVDQNGGASRFHDVGDIFSAFGDIFGDIFGASGGRGRRVSQGADIRASVTISLEEAAKGAQKTIRFRRHRSCETCGGSGARPGTSPEPCQYCGGSGRVVQSTGIFSMQTTCPACKGAGTTIKDPCPDCRGGGFVRDDVVREVNIPAGVDNNTRLRLAGEGEPSPDGGPAGDCYCFIKVTEHPLFERDGQTLVCRVPISYCQAALGAKIDVPTLDGPVALTIPNGTQPGQVFTLRGYGMPSTRYNGQGDLLVQVNLEVPKKLDQEHDELLRKLAEIENAQVTPHRKSFFEKIKEYFSIPEADESSDDESESETEE